MRRQSIAITTVALALLTGAPAMAQTLVSNGQFNTSVAGWADAPGGGTGTATFDATRDADGSPSSGSAALSATGTVSGNVTFKQCFALTPGDKVLWGGKVRFREDETANGSAFTVVVFYQSPGCTGSGVGVGGTQYSPSAGRGIWLDSNFNDAGYTVPAGTQSASLAARVNKTGSGVLTINADKLFFARVSTPRCAGEVPTKVGTSAGETINGTAGTDIIAGLGGNDVIRGRGGRDTLCGDAGDDVIKGGSGGDFLIGGPGDDKLSGGGGNDDLRGGPDTDRCIGGTGAVDVASGCEITNSVP